MKTSQIENGISGFTEAVKAEAKPEMMILPSALTIIKTSFDENQKYSVQHGVKDAIARLKKALSDASATQALAIVYGSFEAGPCAYGMLRGRTGVLIKVWHGLVDTGAAKIRMPTNATVKMLIAEEEDDYGKSVWVKNVLGKKPMTSQEIMTKLVEWNAILSLDDVRKLIKTTSPNPVVAMRVELAGANTMNDFKTSVKQDIWKEVNDTEGKLVAAGPNITLRTEKTEDTETMAWLRVLGPKSKDAQPIIELEDFNELCQDASTKFDNPEDQAVWIANMVTGTQVIVIGAVTGINQNDRGTSINMNVLALLNPTADTSEPIQMGQQALPVEEAPIVDAPDLDSAAPAEQTKVTTSPEKVTTSSTKPPATQEEKAPTKKAQTAKQQIVEETVAEEPVVEEPVAEEAIVEEAVVEETVIEPAAEQQAELDDMTLEAEVVIEETETEEVEELTPELKLIADKMLFSATLLNGGKQADAYSTKLAALRKMSLAETKKMSMMKKFGEENVVVVYNYLIAQEA